MFCYVLSIVFLNNLFQTFEDCYRQFRLGDLICKYLNLKLSFLVLEILHSRKSWDE
ncbi:hypothetical protein D3C73_443060 [compost metagenome]